MQRAEESAVLAIVIGVLPCLRRIEPLLLFIAIDTIGVHRRADGPWRKCCASRVVVLSLSLQTMAADGVTFSFLSAAAQRDVSMIASAAASLSNVPRERSSSGR